MIGSELVISQAESGFPASLFCATAPYQGNQFIPDMHITLVYDAIPIIVPVLFVIGTVGALVYERAQRNSEKPK